jgi:kynurenine 3-monooxygenase
MNRKITLLGAGLVGSLLAVVLRKRGYEVTVYERRPDMRTATGPAGRSINLAMSVRGWAALDLAGLRTDIEDLALPMPGRFLHQADGSTAFQPYGSKGEAIYSVSRGELNKRLMTLAEQEGVQIHFNKRCSHVEVRSNQLQFEDGETVTADLLIGADGAFSALRTAYTHLDRVNASQMYIDQGYKELVIPPAEDGSFRMQPTDALHIWPRRQFMMIALPNPDGSFTCTLFMPFEGEESFDALQTPEAVTAFFQKHFPDAVSMMPTLLEDFFTNPTASLITTRIDPWYYQDKSLLIGDSAHAIVPFYGQGMNAGFEDVRILSELLNQYEDDWATLLPEYNRLRKPNGDAVGALALQNFIEMRDKVADPDFLARKKREKELTLQFPEQFKSVYEMVSFSHTPYDTAIKCTEAQDRLWEGIRHLSTGDPKIQTHLADYDEAVKNLDFGV